MMSSTHSQMPPHPSSGAPILVEIAPGELIDKLTILEIKSQRIADPDKLRNVHRELVALDEVLTRSIATSTELTRLTDGLRTVNASLWNVEDELRDCERRREFGPRFVELARSVYRNNDERAALKRRINDLLGARFVEEKSYARYE